MQAVIKKKHGNCIPNIPELELSEFISHWKIVILA